VTILYLFFKVFKRIPLLPSRIVWDCSPNSW